MGAKQQPLQMWVDVTGVKEPLQMARLWAIFIFCVVKS
jgi:hypothetical protein